jgi:hypothetical protein
MKPYKKNQNDEWLDDILTKAIGSESTKPNFDQWRHNHPEALETLKSHVREYGDTFTARLGNMGRTIMKNKITRFAAAAAVLVCAVTGIYHFAGSLDGATIAWADVINRVSKATTVVFWTEFESTNPDLSRIDPKRKRYVKEPGLLREEFFWSKDLTDKDVIRQPVSPLKEGDLYEVRVSDASDTKEGKRVRLAWQYGSKITTGVRRDTYIGGSGGSKQDPQDLLDMFHGMAGRGAQKAGDFQINNVETILFELKSLKNPGSTQRVWVSKDTKMPVRVESVSVGRENGYRYIIIWDDIQWNVPIPDEMFAPPKGEGRKIHDNLYIHFDNVRFKNDVTFTVSLENGPAVLTEQDIEQITRYDEEYGRKILKVENGRPIAVTARDITVKLTKAASERLRTTLASHGEAVFNATLGGKMISGRTLPSRAQDLPVLLRIDISSFNMTFEQFKTEYLTFGK